MEQGPKTIQTLIIFIAALHGDFVSKIRVYFSEKGGKSKEKYPLVSEKSFIQY